MRDHDTCAELRKCRFILDLDLTEHLRKEWNRDMRDATNEGKLQGRHDRVEASPANLDTPIKILDSELQEQANTTGQWGA